MDDAQLQLARRVRRLRAERCLSQGQLCREAGVSQRALSALENGQSRPRLDTLDRIARALDVPLIRITAGRL